MRSINLFRIFHQEHTPVETKSSARKMMAHTMEAFEARVGETLGTLGHLSIFFLAFLFVMGAFFWKEGKLGGPRTQTEQSLLPSIAPTQVLEEVPVAEVGIRMLMDQANGEMSSDSASFATPSASNSALTESDIDTVDYPILDLNGPWQCNAQNSAGSAQLYIADKNMKFSYTSGTESAHALLRGDCLYNWQGSEGGKQCGLSSYLSLFDEMMGSDGFDVGDLLADQMAQDDATQIELYQLLRASCVAQTPRSDVFTVPQNITWEESNLEDDMWSIF
ncbi:MAG TPA: hypothetical protein PKG71_02405 [Candidatus Woesebacteria bacterium]|nr:hypothetical protein [Candidatus Woesebacteria bacterium]HNS94796.1 hypothetical protein [Candidatus Woesebacteria bacterium]